MTALELKNALAKQHLLELHRIAVITESAVYSNADLISVTQSLFTQEFEIKTSVADLRREAIAIQVAKDYKEGRQPDLRITANSFAFSKFSKHREYLCQDNPRTTLPNEFSFFVPEELETEAMLAVQGTPYGVCLLHKSMVKENHWSGIYRYIEPFHWSVKPKKLHTNKLTIPELQKIMRRVSIESYYLREKVINQMKPKISPLTQGENP